MTRLKTASVALCAILAAGCAELQQRAETVAERVDESVLGASQATFLGCINYACRLVRAEVLSEFVGDDQELADAMQTICTRKRNVFIPGFSSNVGDSPTDAE